jgi:adenylosuccinate synthase
VKFGHKLNGYTSLNLTKLDVLSGIPKIEVALYYELDGKKLDGLMPANIDDLAKCKVITETLDGWDEDISNCRSYEELP